MKTTRNLTLYLGFFKKIKRYVFMSALFRVITVNRDLTHLPWLRRGLRLVKTDVFPNLFGFIQLAPAEYATNALNSKQKYEKLACAEVPQ